MSSVATHGHERGLSIPGILFGSLPVEFVAVLAFKNTKIP